MPLLGVTSGATMYSCTPARIPVAQYGRQPYWCTRRARPDHSSTWTTAIQLHRMRLTATGTRPRSGEAPVGTHSATRPRIAYQTEYKWQHELMTQTR